MSNPIDTFRDDYIREGRDHPQRDVDSVERTAKAHARYLRYFQTWLDRSNRSLSDDVSVGDVRDFRYWLKDEHDLSDGSVRNATGSVSKFFQFERPNEENPVEEWSEMGERGKWTITTEKERETRGEVVYLEPDQVESLIENAETKRSKLIIRLLVSTGIRRSELVSLRCDDVMPETKRVRIYARKTDDYREVGFRSDKLARDLRMWIDHHRASEYGAEETDYLFPPGKAGNETGHLRGETVRNTVRRAADAAGIQSAYMTTADGRTRQKVTPHTLRATFAVQAAKAGVSAPIVRDALGHHDLSVTSIYTSLASGDAADVIAKDGPSF